MIEIEAEDWFNIKGRGTVVTFQWKEGMKVSDLQGKDVKIDGKVYRVVGLEWSRPLYTSAPFTPDDMEGRTCSMIVREKDGQ